MTCVRNARHVAGWSGNRPRGAPVGFTVPDRPPVLWRTADGTAIAFAEDRATAAAEHARIATCAKPRIMPGGHDHGFTPYNRPVDRLAATEAAARETTA